MSDAQDAHDQEFVDEMLSAFTDDPAVVEDTVTPEAQDLDKGASAPAPKSDEGEEGDKNGDPAPNHEGEAPETPSGETQETQAPQASTEETQEVSPTPLTEDGLRRIINDVRLEERNSVSEIENATKEVLDSYYPEGLSEALIDEATGKELRTPQDVVDASGGDMSIEQAAQWLMNKQYEVKQSVETIRNQARQVAETTTAFKRDSIAAVEKYQPLFQQYPALQQKAFDLMMRQVEVDHEHGVVLKAPDVMDLYDTYLEPYQKAFEFAQQQPATAPASQAPAPKPGAHDRLDEGGDGGIGEVDDPNDFAQQVMKEVAG